MAFILMLQASSVSGQLKPDVPEPVLKVRVGGMEKIAMAITMGICTRINTIVACFINVPGAGLIARSVQLIYTLMVELKYVIIRQMLAVK